MCAVQLQLISFYTDIIVDGFFWGFLRFLLDLTCIFVHCFDSDLFPLVLRKDNQFYRTIFERVCMLLFLLNFSLNKLSISLS